MKVQISLDDELLNKIDTVADTLYMSRSGFISFSCVQYLNSIEFISTVKDISTLFRDIHESEKLDDETLGKLEILERLCRSFNQ